MPGRVTLELPDGTKYDLQNPQCEVEGLMKDQKILNTIENLSIRDLTNNYELVLTFDAEQDQRTTGFFSIFTKSPQPTKTGGLEFRRDLLKIEIFKIEEE